jgi:hypothetical protein
MRSENLQLQNRLKSAVNNANSLSQWPHTDIESFLGMIHAELSATATHVWGRKDEFILPSNIHARVRRAAAAMVTDLGAYGEYG